MTVEAEIFTNASPPYDDPKADIIIRSSENVDFRMYKFLLGLASPFFKEMFEVAQPIAIDVEEQETLTRDGVPIIFLYNDQNRVCGKDVVEFVLSSCLPAGLQSGKPQLPVELVGPVIDVATRYGIDWAAKAVLHDPQLLMANPSLVFAHACHKGWAAEAALAAQGSLRFRIQDFPPEPALKLISGYQYHTLWEFHRRCAREVAVIVRGGKDVAEWIPRKPPISPPSKPHPPPVHITWTLNSGKAHSEHCLPPVHTTGNSNSGKNAFRPQWWLNYMDTTAVELESRPHYSTVSDRVRVDETLTKASSCEVCVQYVGPSMRDLVPLIEKKIEKAICQIVAETTFI
ncbi:hypothetical protein DFH08DRAFT_880756 [Mycena albidolilacea]|uniref:BTB domain-containing protein n=1 Tax=Mycena albidolilacea TaxID=1033008 RepID=A0AAD6ZR66_9AGAR|nr:hypothetical protein DFH08DRAFT_880756 [Mycena albidolilacea]